MKPNGLNIFGGKMKLKLIPQVFGKLDDVTMRILAHRNAQKNFNMCLKDSPIFDTFLRNINCPIHKSDPTSPTIRDLLMEVRVPGSDNDKLFLAADQPKTYMNPTVTYLPKHEGHVRNFMGGVRITLENTPTICVDFPDLNQCFTPSANEAFEGQDWDERKGRHVSVQEKMVMQWDTLPETFDISDYIMETTFDPENAADGSTIATGSIYGDGSVTGSVYSNTTTFPDEENQQQTAADDREGGASARDG
jgi:hypothetical protein